MMLIDRADVIRAADRAANAVWQACGGPDAFLWRDALIRHGRPVTASMMASWLDWRRQATAAELYEWATAGEDAKSWDQVRPVLRVSVETFRATLLILLAAMEGTDRARNQAQPVRVARRQDADVVANQGHVAATSEPATGESAAVSESAGLLDPGERRAPAAPDAAAPREPAREVISLERQWSEDDGRPAKRRRG